MKFGIGLLATTVLVGMTALSTGALAQNAPATGPQGLAAGQDQAANGERPAAPAPTLAPRTAPAPTPVPPPMNFPNSTAHFQYLYDLYDGGTQHTYESVPHWEGLWSSASSPIFSGENPFVFTPPGATGRTFFGSGGIVRPGVLTPEYEAATQMRLDIATEYGEQPYDRLTTCEPPGFPRWLLEPYVREFVNTPSQSWWMNDLANDTRRIYIGQEHQNVDNTHSPEGDSIGFWVGDMLVVHTIDIYPNDWFRGNPPTSNQMEAVEIFQMVTRQNGDQIIVDNATFYDPLSLQRPLTFVYTWSRNLGLENAGYRIRHWECTLQNTALDPNGVTTQLFLPGDEQYRDQRGGRTIPDLPADLVGQELNPGEGDELGFPG